MAIWSCTRRPRIRPLRRAGAHARRRHAWTETSLELPGHAEFLLLHYASGDRPVLPVSQADRVVATLAPEMPTRRDALRTASGVRAKAKVRRSVPRSRQELWSCTGATAWRGTRSGRQSRGSGARGQLPYEETPDQVQAIYDSRPHAVAPSHGPIARRDWLRKTEVALRAHFQASAGRASSARARADDRARAAHYNTFRERLGAFSRQVRDVFHRFSAPTKEQREIIPLASPCR